MWLKLYFAEWHDWQPQLDIHRKVTLADSMQLFRSHASQPHSFISEPRIPMSNTGEGNTKSAFHFFNS